MSLFKGHVACRNLTLTGLRVNFNDSLIKGKEFLFEFEFEFERGKLSEFELSAFYCINETMMHALLTKREVNIIAGYC